MRMRCGLGLELALACDLRVASEEAVFAMDQIKYGMMSWDGGTQRLPRLVGRGRGAAMVLTGMEVDAERALEMGLAHALVSEGIGGEGSHCAGAQNCEPCARRPWSTPRRRLTREWT